MHCGLVDSLWLAAAAATVASWLLDAGALDVKTVLTGDFVSASVPAPAASALLGGAPFHVWVSGEPLPHGYAALVYGYGFPVWASPFDICIARMAAHSTYAFLYAPRYLTVRTAAPTRLPPAIGALVELVRGARYAYAFPVWAAPFDICISRMRAH